MEKNGDVTLNKSSNPVEQQIYPRLCSTKKIHSSVPIQEEIVANTGVVIGWWRLYPQQSRLQERCGKESRPNVTSKKAAKTIQVMELQHNFSFNFVCQLMK